VSDRRRKRTIDEVMDVVMIIMSRIPMLAAVRSTNLSAPREHVFASTVNEERKMNAW